MADALLERLRKGAWAGGDLVNDLRKHLAPIVNLDKENEDEYVSLGRARLLSTLLESSQASSVLSWERRSATQRKQRRGRKARMLFILPETLTRYTSGLRARGRKCFNCVPR